MKTPAPKENSTSAKSSQPSFNKNGGSSFLSSSNEVEQAFFLPTSGIQKKSTGSLFSGGNNAAQAPFLSANPLIQTTLSINEPGDKYEQEADAMAGKVMRMTSVPPGGAEAMPQSGISMVSALQRKCAACEDEEKIQREEMKEEEPLQRKEKSTGSFGGTDPIFIQRKCAACEDKDKVQRQKMEEEEPVQTKLLMRKADGGGYTASPQLQSQLNSSKGGGSPLPGRTLSSMNQAFGADFSHVRIHTDSGAAEMSQGIQAKAFTHERDIYFNQGQYSPETGEGKRLLGHELTHVVQQGGGLKLNIPDQPAQVSASTIIQRNDAAAQGTEVLKDERLNPRLQHNKSEIHAKNWGWWNLLGLGTIMPLGAYNPLDVPNAYANRILKLQTLFNKSKLYESIGKRLSEDGILGQQVWFILFSLAKKAHDKDPQTVSFLIANENEYHIQSYVEKIHVTYSALGEQGKEQFEKTEMEVLAEIFKPKKIAEWKFTTSIPSLVDFLRLNEIKFQKDKSGVGIPREMYDSMIWYLLKDETEAENTIQALSFTDKLEMFRIAFGDEGKVNSNAIIFEAKRQFTHEFDTERLNPKKNYLYDSFGFHSPSGAFLEEMAPILSCKFPKEKKVEEARATMLKEFNSGTSIIGMVFWFYLPKVTKQASEEAKEYIINRTIEIQAEEVASLEFLSELNDNIEARKKGKPDVTDPDTFLELITYPANDSIRNKDKIESLLKKAEENYALIVKLDPSAEPFVLPFTMIGDLHAKALKNQKSPLRYGEFDPKHGIYRIHVSKYKATVNDENVEVRIWQTIYSDQSRTFGRFEPVKVEFGLITQKLFRGIKYNLQSFWTISDSLPDIARQLENVEEKSKTMEGLNILITALSGAFLVAGAARAATGSAVASQVGKSFTIELFKRSLWFVVEEKIAEELFKKFAELDQMIQDDKDLSDTDKKVWNAFKIGLMVIGGAVVLRQAWKGLKNLAPSKFASHADDFERALLKAEGTAVTRGGSSALKAVIEKAKSRVAVIGKPIEDAWKWGASTLKLSALTLKDLTVQQIQRLKRLPSWVLDQMRLLSERLKRLIMGCHSPCVIDENAILKYNDIIRFRKKAGLPAFDPDDSATGAVASVDVDGKTFFGVNTGFQEGSAKRALRVEMFEKIKDKFPNAKYWPHVPFLMHAEAYALLRAAKSGKLASEVVMYVDKITCPWCFNDLTSLMRALGIKKLTIFNLGSKTPITLTVPSVRVNLLPKVVP